MEAKQDLRSGFTTGACAAAATKAALLALVRQSVVSSVVIRLPIGQLVKFALHLCRYSEHEGMASVIKDAGDDPDVTDKAEIVSRVSWTPDPGINFLRGMGVGLVTRKGLPIPPGEPAINPAPRALIQETVADVLAEHSLAGRGLTVEISVPRGEELAKKTFNPRLGIVGGISILGTTGIVVPYSTSAWVASVVQEIDVAVAAGLLELVLTVGARSEKVARDLWPDRPEESFVQVGPFFGEALRHCAKVGVKQLTLAAMIGKLAKFAAGSDSVHSTASTQDFEFLSRIAQQCGASETLCRKIASANTAQEVSDLSTDHGIHDFHRQVCIQAMRNAQSIVSSHVELTIVLLGMKGDILGRCSSA